MSPFHSFIKYLTLEFLFSSFFIYKCWDTLNDADILIIFLSRGIAKNYPKNIF